MKITILTLFPDYFQTPFASSMLKRAQAAQAVEYEIVAIRQFAHDKHNTTDDRPYGGGPGMVLKVEPVALALDSVLASPQPNQSTKPKIILTSARGQLYTQAKAITYAQSDHLVIICGHYEGVDQRIADHLVDEEVSIGEYILTGGEPAAAVIVDSITRLLPGVLGNAQSTEQESYAQPGMKGAPQYTRPEKFRGWKVPQVLLTGDHAAIEAWRAERRDD